MDNSTENFEIKHSKKTMVSYSFGSFFGEFIGGVFALMLFYFYENEVKLDSLLVGLGLAIFAIWDAFNDPLVGYLTDRPFKFTKKWGRRFPWIVIFYIPMLMAFLLIFSPPSVDPVEGQWILFIWLVFSTCLFDTLESIFTINFRSLFPDKFRSSSERLTSSGIIVYIGFAGILLAFIVPPMIISFGDISSYILMAWIAVVICIITYLLMIPGVKDDKEAVERYLESYDKLERESFFKALKEAFKQRSFLAFLILFMLYQVLTQTMGSSFVYVVNFVIKEDPAFITFFSLMMFAGGLISLPIWYKYTQKTKNYRKTMIMAGLIMICFAAILTFILSIMAILIIVFIFGMGVGGFWVMISPGYSDVIDESIIRTGKRREGLYSGFLFFVGNIARVIQALILAFVHELTGFVEGALTQSSTALMGIQLHFGLIPAIIMGIGILVFWKFYDITPEKVKEIKEKIVELKL